MEIKTDYSLKNLNTFGIEVRVKKYAEADSLESLSACLSEFSQMPKLILGGGSNILFTKDFDGLIIRMRLKGIELVHRDSSCVYVKAGAGEIWDDLVDYALNNNFGGLENLSLIPGTVGASPIQNIGAYGVEVKDVLHEVEGINLTTGKIEIYSNEACRFGYRNSLFKQELKNNFVVTSVTYRLSLEPKVNVSYEALKKELAASAEGEITIREVSEAVKRVRRSKLPDPGVLGNAGSFFKNPEIDKENFLELKAKHQDLTGYETPTGRIKIPAGYLIQKSGWKGRRLGNAGSYEKQALILVNYGGATGSEVLQLSSAIKESVYKEFGVHLETEVNII
ncbi:MAG: UDP-N-acetylmuramate dehydrogenase [Ignavibacteria bacterium]|jgi:UDP-N-acetylmuramate dehydrogenase|nr:UDP-N-acetylmuramate dehydrogenase [Ignavibacteria bacterium]MCU7504041.1 UDP-N-acetylmuramate dehydrogenase [Ignavibacteria bacterium]MCU7515413.1 UDP-N-acetylmuramate dehydrogenase [Ignavibacteria bacterium]